MTPLCIQVMNCETFAQCARLSGQCCTPPTPLPTSDIMLQGLEDAFLCIMTVMSKSMGGE